MGVMPKSRVRGSEVVMGTCIPIFWRPNVMSSQIELTNRMTVMQRHLWWQEPRVGCGISANTS